MIIWKVVLSKRATEDANKITKKQLQDKVKALFSILQYDPYKTPPYFEKLRGVENKYSRRLNNKDRLLYEIFKDQNLIIIKSILCNYDDN